MSAYNSIRRLGMAAIFGATSAIGGVGVAQAEDVEFTATVAGTCTIEVTKQGTLKIGDNFQTLTSANATAGRVKVRATAAGYKLSVADPTGWDTQPATNDDAGAAFTASYTPDTGGETFAGTATDLAAGVEVKADVDLTVTQTNDYAAGDYKGIVVVTCD